MHITKNYGNTIDTYILPTWNRTDCIGKIKKELYSRRTHIIEVKDIGYEGQYYYLIYCTLRIALETIFH